MENQNRFPNDVHVAGYVTWVGSPRQFDSGAETVSFFMAFGKDKKRTYIPVKAWGEQVKQVTGLKVSDHVEVRGRLTSWEQKATDGAKARHVLEVTASDVRLLGSNGADDSDAF